MTKKSLDRLFSAYAILHDGRCVCCGSMNETLQGGHFFGRTRQSTKWDFRNCYCQCARCNALHENNTEPLRRVVIKRLGEAGLAKLEADSSESYPDPDVEWTAEMMLKVIRTLPRFKKLSDTLKGKIERADFTNKELVKFIIGY